MNEHTGSLAQQATAGGPFPRIGRLGGALLRYCRRDVVGAVAWVVVLLFAVVAVFGAQLAPHDPLAVNARQGLLPPGGSHLMGTDQIGRDVFSRVLAGSRWSLFVVLVPTLLSACIGSTIGLFAGHLGGYVDDLCMRSMDVLLALPALILGLAIVAGMGASVRTLSVALTVPSIPIFAKVIRQQSVVVHSTPFVDAAVALGASTNRIVFRHILPNVLPLLIVVGTSRLALLLLTASSLSFLGAGIPPPAPDWGNIVANGSRHLLTSPWEATLGGAVIFFCTLAFNLIGDSLRDELDPQLRNR